MSGCQNHMAGIFWKWHVIVSHLGNTKQCSSAKVTNAGKEKMYKINERIWHKLWKYGRNCNQFSWNNNHLSPCTDTGFLKG